MGFTGYNEKNPWVLSEEIYNTHIIIVFYIFFKTNYNIGLLQYHILYNKK